MPSEPWRPPVPGPPAWYEFDGRRYYRIPTGYYVARDGCKPSRLHIAIWEKVNGRTLRAGYVVHHIDHNPENNEPGNLMDISHTDHDRHHRGGLKRSPESVARMRRGIKEAWEDREPRKLTCQFCGQEFETRATRDARTCSKRCANLLRRHERGETVFRPGSRACDYCGSEFTPKDGRSHLCSRDCANGYLRDKRRAERAS